MSDRVFDWLAGPRSTRVIGWATMALAALTLLIVGRFGPTLLTNSENARRTDDLAACRAEARAGFDSASIRLATATANVQAEIALGLTAAVLNDDAGLLDAANSLKAATDQVTSAISDLTNEADHYGESVILSREDPDEFLKACT